jgi:iron complex transport system substrate-binding protein
MREFNLLKVIFVFMLIILSISGFCNDVVIDSLGRSVKLPQILNRISLTGKAVIMISDVVFMFPEAVNQVSAIANTTQDIDDFLNVIDPKINTKIRLDNNAGTEQILATKPDLVMMKSYLAKQSGEALVNLGIPVVYLDLETPDQFMRDIKIIGAVFNNEKRAVEIINYYQRKIQQATKQVDKLAKNAQPRTLFLYYSQKGGNISFNVPPQSWMQTQLIKMAGGNPVWEDQNTGNGWLTVNFEQIAAWNPENIYVVAYNINVSEVVKNLLADPNWQKLKAFKNKKIKAFPSDYYSWDQPDSRWILGLTWLAKDLHPELLSDVDMITELKEFYQKLYNLDQKVVLDKIIPRYTGGTPGQ